MTIIAHCIFGCLLVFGAYEAGKALARYMYSNKTKTQSVNSTGSETRTYVKFLSTAPIPDRVLKNGGGSGDANPVEVTYNRRGKDGTGKAIGEGSIVIPSASIGASNTAITVTGLKAWVDKLEPIGGFTVVDKDTGDMYTIKKVRD